MSERRSVEHGFLQIVSSDVRRIIKEVGTEFVCFSSKLFDSDDLHNCPIE